MLALEPVPALTSMLFSLKMAKLSDEALAARVAAVDGRVKQTRSSDAAGWASIYREALELIPAVVGAQQQQQQQQQQAQSQQAARQKMSSLSSVVPQKLQRAFNDWGARLQEQVQELKGKAERASQRLNLASVDDEERGETVFKIEDKELSDFWAWLAGAEGVWRENNGKLVAVRANELMGDLLRDLPPGVTFEVRPAELAGAAPSAPALKGHRIPTPSKFEALGTTYKTVMGGVMAASSVGFLATKFAGNKAAELLPWAFAAVFASSIAYAAATVPKQFKQAMARKKADAAERVKSELLQQVRERLEHESAAQLSAIKKHLLQAEEQRWSRLVQEQGGGAAGGLGGLAAAPVMASIGGLSAQDLARLQGEWREAIEARLSQLSGA